MSERLQIGFKAQVGRLFSQYAKLNLTDINSRHIKTHDRTHVCTFEICQYATSDLAHLRRHQEEKHAVPEENTWICTVSWCKKFGKEGFKRKDNLERHWKKHPGEPWHYG
ncbi:hypothetical protein EG328_010417 [Venturia inaequalis]|uniref:C2H2-type domain-containing protein n=1 Tax=Venturia inaequalis TaxID=5025 RepID=A0A8H3U7I2_VENIN|nr:hypothetical protein EG328_010417 [Venturia inaequalis]